MTDDTMTGEAFLDDVKAAIAEAGFPAPNDADLMRAVKDAVNEKLGPAHTAIFHMSEDEMLLLHSRISSALRLAGLKGAALDQAIASAFREAIRPIERERGTDWTRRATIKEVIEAR